VPGGVDAGEYVFTYDANGNVAQVLDLSAGSAAAAIVAHYEYDPYGGVVNDLSGYTYAEANPIRFSTKYWDAETGLGYWGYRYYSARLGRWLSRDPIGETGGTNLYAAVRNSPTKWVDPDGQRILRPIGGPDDTLCSCFCLGKGYKLGSREYGACSLGCLNGSNRFGAPCDSFCQSSPTPETRGACQAGCQAHLPNLGSLDGPCDRTYNFIGHGRRSGGRSGWPEDDSGRLLTPTRVRKEICPRLCWGATLVLWTCYTGADNQRMREIAEQCPKISRIVSCKGDLKTGPAVGGRPVTWWCPCGWNSLSVNDDWRSRWGCK
jgi:RHS repeat-associated protein